jgi:hypothetical protein
MKIDSELKKEIEKEIEEFIVDAKNPEYLKYYVKKLKVLPLYNDWTNCLSINAEGEIINFCHDEEKEPKVETDEFWCNMALFQGSKKYPKLATLISKPANAVLCIDCNGSGIFPLSLNPKYKNIICSCGGLGWILAAVSKNF